MSTTPTTPTVPTWVSLLLGIGGALGQSFVANPGLQALIALAITEATNLINILSQRGTQPIGIPVFLTVLQAAIAVLVETKQITADEAAALQKAVTDTLAADSAGKLVVDPTTLTPLAPLA